jgi:hypothetical protein
MATLDRSVFIALLQRLGAESDEEALAAARELHRTIAESGMNWDDLLIPDSRPQDLNSEPDTDEEDATADAEDDAADGDDELEEDQEEEDEDEDDDDDDDNDEEADAAPVVAPDEPRTASPEEDARTIERLLAIESLSKETRDELTGFQRDVAEGRLSAMDSQYIAALARRLGA